MIANGTGAAVRSDLNNALAAIVSNNSSSSEPATTYAYQFWADTNANVLKIRNSANNAWITLRELDGTMLIEDGSVGSPGLAFADDTDTGIFSPGANEIAFTTGGAKRVDINGTEVVINDASNDVDFRVESDGNTHMLFVNADTDRVGVNQSAPNAKLHVTSADSGVNPNASADELFVESDGNTGITIGSPATGTGRISFGDPAGVQVGKILYDHSSNFLSFDTASSEALRINNGGKVLVNTTAVLDSNAAAKLQVQESTGALLALGRDGTGVTAGDDIGKIAFYGNDAGDYQKCAMIKCEADGSHADNDKPSRLVFSVTKDGSGTVSERMRINSRGELLLGTADAIADTNDSAIHLKDASGGNIYFLRDDSSVAGGNDIGSLRFYSNDGGTNVECARLQAEADGSHSSTSRPGRFVLSTVSDGTTTLRQRFLLNRNGLTEVNSADHGIDVGVTNGSGTSARLYTGRHSATNDKPGSGTIAFRVFSQGNVQNTNNSYGSISDAKLKENIVDANSQWDDIKAVQVRNFNFKEGTDNPTHTQIGVVAQEVETVSPGLVYETPDRETVQVPTLDENGEAVLDENGEALVTDEERDLGTVTKNVNYSVLYMKAVKALQEAMERIETLETKVAALEAG